MYARLCACCRQGQRAAPAPVARVAERAPPVAACLVPLAHEAQVGAQHGHAVGELLLRTHLRRGQARQVDASQRVREAARAPICALAGGCSHTANSVLPAHAGSRQQVTHVPLARAQLSVEATHKPGCRNACVGQRCNTREVDTWLHLCCRHPHELPCAAMAAQCRRQAVLAPGLTRTRAWLTAACGLPPWRRARCRAPSCGVTVVAWHNRNLFACACAIGWLASARSFTPSPDASSFPGSGRYCEVGLTRSGAPRWCPSLQTRQRAPPGACRWWPGPRGGTA